MGETEQTSPRSLSAAERLAQAAAELPGVTAHRVEYGEAVVEAGREGLLALIGHAARRREVRGREPANDLVLNFAAQARAH